MGQAIYGEELALPACWQTSLGTHGRDSWEQGGLLGAESPVGALVSQGKWVLSLC